MHARTAFGGACASSMPDPALRLLQHYERHTSTIPIGRSCPRPPSGLTHCPFTNDSPRQDRLQRATRLDLDASHCLEAAPSEEEDPGHRSPFPARARARAERTDEARVKVKSAQFPGGFGCPDRFGYRGGLTLSPSLLDAASSPSCRRARERCRMVPAPSLALGLGQPSHSAPRRAVLLGWPRCFPPFGTSTRRGSLPRLLAGPLVHAALERALQAGETAPFVSSLASPRIDVRSGGGRLGERGAGRFSQEPSHRSARYGFCD